MMDGASPDSLGCTYSATKRIVTVAECRRFVEFIGLSRTASERCSALFLFELFCHATIPSLPGDPAKIVAEVRGLEGLGSPVGTKPEQPFDRPPLRGLWKKHYLVGGTGSVAENIRLGWGRKRRGLHQIVDENYNPTTAYLSSEAISGNIANVAVANIYVERSLKQCLTGEWIVYAKYEGKNYYLCLGMHGEDECILDQIKRGCLDEFPFLRCQLNL